MPRVTWSLSEEAAQRLETTANRKPEESANDFVLRVAAMCDDDDADTDVTECDTPENVLTEAHIEDIATRTARKTGDEVETRFR